MKLRCKTCGVDKTVPRRFPLQPAFAHFVRGTTYKGHRVALPGQGSMRHNVKSAAYAVHQTEADGDGLSDWISVTRIPDRFMPEAMEDGQGELTGGNGPKILLSTTPSARCLVPLGRGAAHCPCPDHQEWTVR